MFNIFKPIILVLLLLLVMNILVGNIFGAVLAIWSFIFFMAEINSLEDEEANGPTKTEKFLDRVFFLDFSWRMTLAELLGVVALIITLVEYFGILK